MMVLNAKFLEAKQLPARDPYPPSTLLTLLADSETISLVGPEELYAQVAEVKELTPLWLELAWRKFDLGSLGVSQKGPAYKLRAVQLVSQKELGT